MSRCRPPALHLVLHDTLTSLFSPQLGRVVLFSFKKFMASPKDRGDLLTSKKAEARYHAMPVMGLHGQNDRDLPLHFSALLSLYTALQ